MNKVFSTVHFGSFFALKQWISSSLKHDTVPRVINLYLYRVFSRDVAGVPKQWNGGHFGVPN